MDNVENACEKKQTRTRIFDVDKMRETLNEMAGQKPPSKRQTACGIVEELEDEINILKSKGYSFLEISRALHTHAPTISVNTFQNYIGKMNKKYKKAKGESNV